MAGVSRESILFISALLKRLIYVISENRSYDKELSELPYLPSAFVLFINFGHFVITEKGLFFWLYVIWLKWYFSVNIERQ